MTTDIVHPAPPQLEPTHTMQPNDQPTAPRSPTARPVLTRRLSASIVLARSFDPFTSASMATQVDPLDGPANHHRTGVVLSDRRRSSTTSGSFSSASSVSSYDSETSSVVSSSSSSTSTATCNGQQQNMVLEKLVALVVAETRTEAHASCSNVTMETAVSVLYELACDNKWKSARACLADPVAVVAFAQLLERESSNAVKAKAVSLLWMISTWTASRRGESTVFVATLVGGSSDLVRHVAQVHTSEAIGLLRTIVSHHPNPAALESITVASKLVSLANDCLGASDARMRERTAGLVWVLSMQSTVLASALADCAGQLVAALRSNPSKSLQENSAGALWSISNHQATRADLRRSGAVHALVEVVAHGSPLARDHAAGALLHLGRSR